MNPPEYFNRIQAEASKRWEQLDNEPELAGPWHQLFRQVQSPRHVLSELLQNADDVGATEATAEIKDGEFIFSHDGEDFDEVQFASLCRFGFSNKRTLHTIGFRGVGFKSTFSLGNEVRLYSETLSVAFQHKRFTEPYWSDPAHPTGGRTEIRVVIRDKGIQEELETNLREWWNSPASLLFFRNIRCLRIETQEIRWASNGCGPVEDSAWMSVSTAPGERYLVIRSSEERFPEDVLEEIKRERMAADDDETYPECRVEIVVGMDGRLFVVLPTGVKTNLPFACNAPFIQDPARMSIKDPALSPTNRWLLGRVGKLAARSMLCWIVDGSETVPARCEAYGLLPDVDREDSTIGGKCGAIAEESFENTIQSTRFLLSEGGTLEGAGQCLVPPIELLNVWSPSDVSRYFTDDGMAILSRHVAEDDQKKLVNWGLVKNLARSQVIERLRGHNIARPDSSWQLLILWEYVSRYSLSRDLRGLRIVPVRGQHSLASSGDVVRLGQNLNLTWHSLAFLTELLLILDREWIVYLDLKSQAAETGADTSLGKLTEAANRVLRDLQLATATSASRIIALASKELFSRESWAMKESITLAQIAAKLQTSVPDDFCFFNQESRILQAKQPILADLDGDLDLFVDSDWYDENILLDAYSASSETCTTTEWKQWVQSPASRLHSFVPLVETRTTVMGRGSVRETMASRGLQGDLYFHYKTSTFSVSDWDFDKDHWAYWESRSLEDDHFWSDLLSRILMQGDQFWASAIHYRVDQVATTGNTRPVTQEALVALWILKLRNLPCLIDATGRPRQPAELLLRTPDTEPLLGVEAFVKGDIDREGTRNLLLMLGVRDKPTGPEPLIERLQTLASNDIRLLPEVQKWCYSLDQLTDRCSTEELQKIRTAFATNKLILTNQDTWASRQEVFLSPNEEDLPDATLVHSSLRNLALWRKIGVGDRPTADLAIKWLQGLASGQSVTAGERRTLNQYLPLYPSRIWEECGHWLSLDGKWTPVDHLAYSLAMQALTPWNHLFPHVKGMTADLRSLNAETCQGDPFSSLERLSDVIEERFQESMFEPLDSEVHPWIVELGRGLQRVIVDDIGLQSRISDLAFRLAETRSLVAEGLESTPCIKGVPAGTSRTIEVLWHSQTIYVRTEFAAAIASSVTQELGRPFENQEVAEAIKLCYQRPPEFIVEYLEAHFNLAPRPTAEAESSVGTNWKEQSAEEESSCLRWRLWGWRSFERSTNSRG